MRPRHVHRLPRQEMDGLRVVCHDGVVRQVHMEIERLNTIEPSSCIQVLIDGERMAPLARSAYILWSVIRAVSGGRQDLSQWLAPTDGRVKS